MICKKDKRDEETSNLKLFSTEYWLDSSGISNILIYCSACEKQAEYVKLRELVKNKMLPVKNPLFSSEKKLRVIRTDGSVSEGHLQSGMTLGWSSSMNEITAWVWLPATWCWKPLLLSLLFDANPEVKNLPEFKNGLIILLETEEMLKIEFPEFYAKIQTSITTLNQKYFAK
jgi:hypothetical protein